MNRLKLSALLGSGAVVASLAGVIAAMPSHAADAPSQAAAIIPTEPLAAFRRPATGNDALPKYVADGLVRMNGSTTGNARLLATKGPISVYLVKEGETYCIVQLVPSLQEGSIACNDYPSIEKGYLYTASLHGVTGILPDGVAAAEVVSSTKSESVKTDNGVYFSSTDVAPAEFTGLKFSSPSGNSVTFAPPR